MTNIALELEKDRIFALYTARGAVRSETLNYLKGPVADRTLDISIEYDYMSGIDSDTDMPGWIHAEAWSHAPSGELEVVSVDPYDIDGNMDFLHGTFHRKTNLFDLIREEE